MDHRPHRLRPTAREHVRRGLAVSLALITPLVLAGARRQRIVSLDMPQVATDSCPTAPDTVRVHLAAGASVTRWIDSREERNRTGLQVDSGAAYRFSARGTWKDGRIPGSTAGGFRMRDVPLYLKPGMFLGQPLRRASSARWFALVGELSTQPKEFFVIGDSLPSWTAATSGQLNAFANDVHHLYGNNTGCVALTVQRLSP